MNTLPLLIEDLDAEALVALVADTLADLDSDSRTEFLKAPALLGVACEATLAGMDPVEMLEGYLAVEDLATLEAHVSEALLARLPAI